MRFRQIHLDFHNDASVKIGENFSKQQFQEMLSVGNVDSITIFAKCFHGWAYYETSQFEMHPGLKFDLLGEMIEAAHEIGVRTPVYLNTGLNEQLARRHPEWLARNDKEHTFWDAGFMEPGLHVFCFNSPYLDVAVRQIEEVVARYDADGIFLDIVFPKACYCHNCMNTMRMEGLNPRNYDDVTKLGDRVYANYTREVNERVRAIKPDMEIFHNSGIRCGRRDLIETNSHLEVESLPSGGWGYDYFPISARYFQQFDKHLVGMTARFHKNWGEFGGYKHPNAMMYETALCLVHGAQCSVGDHLHPDGIMDPIVYEMIGRAYKEVKAKEEWCRNVTNIADVAILAVEALGPYTHRMGNSDKGAYRIMQEGHLLFDIVDMESEFSKYKVLILPDSVKLSSDLAQKLQRYIDQGGKILATGQSGLNEAGNKFLLDFGVTWLGENTFNPDYIKPHFPLPSLGEGTFVCYSHGQVVELTDGTVWGHREDPYFNRDYDAYYFTHTPNSRNNAGPGLIEGKAGIYFAWNAFEDYAEHGSIWMKEILLHAIDRLLGTQKTLKTSIPSLGVVSLQHQEQDSRYIHHLLYATPVRRGLQMEVIEDIVPLYDIQVQIQLSEAVTTVYLAPQRTSIDFVQDGMSLRFQVPRVECHQMVVIEYE